MKNNSCPAVKKYVWREREIERVKRERDSKRERVKRERDSKRERERERERDGDRESGREYQQIASNI